MTEPVMSKKQAEFFAYLILICTVTAILVLVIDYSIKGAILQESNALRRVIEGHGQGTKATNSDGSSANATDNVAYPADLVDSRTPRMEEARLDPASNGTGPKAARRPANPKTKDGPSGIPDSN